MRARVATLVAVVMGALAAGLVAPGLERSEANEERARARVRERLEHAVPASAPTMGNGEIWATAVAGGVLGGLAFELWMANYGASGKVVHVGDIAVSQVTTMYEVGLSAQQQPRPQSVSQTMPDLSASVPSYYSTELPPNFMETMKVAYDATIQYPTGPTDTMRTVLEANKPSNWETFVNKRIVGAQSTSQFADIVGRLVDPVSPVSQASGGLRQVAVTENAYAILGALPAEYNPGIGTPGAIVSEWYQEMYKARQANVAGPEWTSQLADYLKTAVTDQVSFQPGTALFATSNIVQGSGAELNGGASLTVVSYDPVLGDLYMDIPLLAVEV